MKKILISMSIITSCVLYAAPPTSSDIIKEVEPNKMLLEKKNELIDLPIEELSETLINKENTKKILIKDFLIEGNISISDELLSSLISEYKNKKLNFSEIKYVVSLITKEYREQGFFVSRAYIPKQNMQDSILKIAIIEGNYGDFKLKNNSQVKDFLVQGTLDRAKDKKVVSTSSLERAMLIINSTPGVKVTQADVLPGQEVGTSDFKITADPTPWYNGYVILDNHGGRYTERNKLSVGTNFNNPFNIGDEISINGIISKNKKLKNGRVAYDFPMMTNGLRGEISYNFTDYSLAKEYATLNATGKSKSLEVKVSYPIIKTRLEELIISSTYANKSLKDYLDGAVSADKSIDSLNISLDYTKNQNLLGLDSQIKTGVTFTTGSLDFNDLTSKLTDARGDKTEGRYNKINGYVSTNSIINPWYSLSSTLEFQKALNSKNLDGSEDMSLGGVNGIKVYPSSELSAENGYTLNLELTRKLPSINNLSHNMGIFYDIGRVSMADDSNNLTFKKRTLQDVGISYSANYKDFFLNAKFASVIGGHEVTAEPKYNNKFLIQIGWSF